MERKRTMNDLVMIKLDPENDSIKLRNGFELFVDTTFDVEKHATVTGKVFGLPSHLQYSGKANIGMPWLTPMELQYGDDVIFYYLSVINALKPDSRRYVLEGKDRYVFIPYQFIYAMVRDEKLTPLNGYCLVEPVEDPAVVAERERFKKLGLEQVVLRKDSITNVVYGKVKYVGIPNRAYVDPDQSDEGVDVSVDDIVISKKVSDIPMQFELHQKVNEGKKLLRIQRRNIFAKL